MFCVVDEAFKRRRGSQTSENQVASPAPRYRSLPRGTLAAALRVDRRYGGGTGLSVRSRAELCCALILVPNGVSHQRVKVTKTEKSVVICTGTLLRRSEDPVRRQRGNDLRQGSVYTAGPITVMLSGLMTPVTPSSTKIGGQSVSAERRWIEWGYTSRQE